MKKAFTLTELLVVVILIGILASLAIPRFGKSTNKAMEAEAKIALSQVQELQKIYYLENKTYTKDLAKLGFEQELTVKDDEKLGTARYKISIESADEQDFIAVATAVVEDLSNYQITKQGKASLK